MMSNNKQGGVLNIIFSIIVLFVLCGVLAISACFAITPAVAEQFAKNQQQQQQQLNNNNEDKSPQEFTYIKNLIHSQAADRNEFSNILINDQDFIGNQRRTYLQQFRDKLVNTHKGKLHFDIKLEDEEEDDDEEEESGANHSSNRLNYQIYNVDEADIIDLEQQKHAHTDEDNGDDTTQLDSVSLVRRNNIDGTSGSSSDSSSTTNQSSKSNAGMPSSNTNGAEITNTRVKLLFDPPSLDFEERPLCNPIAKTFTITKEDADEEESLQITTVSTDSLLFHPSVSKKENNKITINVIFLPRILKRSEGVITINTNFGVFTYKAFGGGIENAYNIKPILGHKLPVGADYRKPIFMHNPHQNESLLIKEIYTSEDFLLLSLPDQNSNDKTYNKKNPLLSLWKIEPHQTKSIILLNFHANQPKKHTGFVHVNTNRGQFIIPVEFIVSKSGVHRVVEEIDFGTFISANEKRTRDIVLLNSSPNPVLVSEASIANTDAQLKLEFTKNTILQEGSISSVAKVTYTSQVQGEFTGKIILKTNDTSSGTIEVPYRSRIIHGTLDYRMNSTAFYCGDGKEKINEMVLMNGFDVPIKFTSADVFDKRFTIEDFTSGSVLEKASKKKVLSIRFNPSDSYLIHKTNLILHTNITRLYIPLYSYHGNLDHIPINAEKNILDIEAANGPINMGILGLSSRKIQYFTVSNMNPVPIKIFDWKVTGMTNKKSSISISYVKIYQPDDDLGSLTLIKPTKLSESINSKHADGNKDSFIFAILPNQKIIMRLDIYTPTSDEEQNGFIEFITQYKSLAIPLKFICMEGSLSITNQLPFDVTFPGKIQKKNIYATNTFGRAITISEIKSSDERFVPVITHKTIEANQKMNIGYVTLDASKVPKEKNYMMDDGKSSTSTSSYNKKSSTISSEEFTKYRWRNSLFEDIKNAGDTTLLGTVSLQTDIGINYNINVSTSLEYPKLSPVRQINFKLTHIGTSASQYLIVENPSDHFISLQLILGNGSLAKFLQRNAKGNVPKIDGQGDKSYTEFRLPKDGMNSANIPPHRHANLGPIIFTPKSDSAPSVAYLYIRNNLTIFDIVKLTGNGGSSKLIFSENGNDLASLKFEIKESQLGTWDNYTNRFVQNNYSSNNGSEESQKTELVFHKKFILQNKGNMPVTILGSSIDNMGCNAYGVKLYKCGKFELQPGQTTSYKISYKPDFTTAVVDLFIRIDTDQGKLSYPIRLTLPYNVLPYFYETQPISTGHRLFRVAATFIVLTLALYIIFRACRELKTLDATDNELPTSITDFLKPNFSISSFPFITFPSMDAEKHNQNKNDEEKVLNAEEENKKKKASEKAEKKKKPKTNQSPSIPKSEKSKNKPKHTKPVSSHNNSNEEEENAEKSTVDILDTETESTGDKTEVVVDRPSISKSQPVSVAVLKEEKEEKSSAHNNTINTNNVTSEIDTSANSFEKNEKKSIYKKFGVDKKAQNEKKASFASSNKKKFNETEANIIIKPKVFTAVPTYNPSNSNEKPKFYAVKAANGGAIDTNGNNMGSVNGNNIDLSVLSPSSRSRTPNSNEMARFARENHQAISTTEVLNNMISTPSMTDNIKTRERSSSDSATYKNLLDNNTPNSSNLLDDKSTCSTDVGSTGNLSGLLSDSMAPSPSSNSLVENDVLSLLRSASVSPPPVGPTSSSPVNNTTNQHKEQVGVIGNNNTRRDFGFGQASQPYWYFGGASTASSNSFFGQGNNFIGNNSNSLPFAPNPQFNSFNAPPVVNRLAATFQHRPTNYFSLFDSRPNSLFSTDTNSSFFSNLNQRSNNSSPSNSDSTTGTPDITSSLFSYVLPAEDAGDEQQQHLK